MPKQQLKLSEDEKLLVLLQKVAVSRLEGQNEKARSLVKWYMENQYWTKAQKDLVRMITGMNSKKSVKKATPKVAKRYYLYAISNGSNIKVGYTCDVKARLANLQTGSSTTLSKVWQVFAGYGEAHARVQEKALHRYIKAYSVRGEWFEMDSLKAIESFKVKVKK
jgi:hypothetical protein